MVETINESLWVFQYTHTHPFSRTTRVGRYQKGITNLGFTEARDSEWQWHQLGHMQVCTSLQTDNHACTSPLSFLQAGYPSCRPTNSVKALKAHGCSNTCPTNPRWWMAILKTVKSSCLHNCLTNFDVIWNCDAHWSSKPHAKLVLIFKNLIWQTATVLKIEYLLIYF